MIAQESSAQVPEAEANAGKDGERRSGNKQCSGESLEERLNALCGVAGKADRVVADRDYGQAFNKVLKPDLQRGAVFERGEQFRVLVLDPPLDARAKKLGELSGARRYSRDALS